MTAHTQHVALAAPLSGPAECPHPAEACNRAANALGRNGTNLTVRLSPTGLPPATHLGAAAVETDAFLQVLSHAPGLPVAMPWPEELDPADWQAVAGHLTVQSGPIPGTNPRALFQELLAAMGLKRVTVEEE